MKDPFYISKALHNNCITIVQESFSFYLFVGIFAFENYCTKS
jgi:hypothetical protein